MWIHFYKLGKWGSIYQLIQSLGIKDSLIIKGGEAVIAGVVTR